MSYTVGLLVEPAVEDDAQAFEFFDTLREGLESDTTPHPTFVKMHADLTARYPCICDLPDDAVDDGVWSDGPLIHNFGELLGVIGWTFSSSDEVLPFVVTVAGLHGVTVFDWQTGKIHRPGLFRRG